MKTSALFLFLSLLLLLLPPPCAAEPSRAGTTAETALAEDDGFPEGFAEEFAATARDTAETGIGGATPIPDGATFLRLLAKMLVATAVAAFLIVLLARFLNRARSLSAAGHIRVLDRCALAANKTVWLVRVHGKLLVVGTAGETIAPLAEFTDPEEIRAVLLEYNLGATGHSFAEHLQTLAGTPEPPES